MITYRQLLPEEFDGLQAALEKDGQPKFAESALMFAWVAEEDGQIVGVLPVQLAAHIEPLWIHSAKRGQVSWKKLEKLANDFFSKIPGSAYYAFAPTGSNVEKMTRISGLRELPYSVWVKEF